MKFVSLLVLLFAHNLVGWQDDVLIDFSSPIRLFSPEDKLALIENASAEVRLGRYLAGDSHHAYRAGLEGDVALIQFSDSWLWQFGLNMETLVDDHNDIHFRLVHVYYQALTGLLYRLGSGAFHFGYRHRCSHGADAAEQSRITIRSGITSTYSHLWSIASVDISMLAGINIYLLGQNRDLSMHPKGGSFLSVKTSWPIRGSVYGIFGAGINAELVAAHTNWVYSIASPITSWTIEPLFATRIGARIKRERITSDFVFHFAQNLDSGISPRAQKTHSLSFDLDFHW